jgi:ABC-type tungstate transport system substrate-binding protein
MSTRVKTPKEFWDVRTSKKFKKLGIVLGGMGTALMGASAVGLPNIVSVAGFVLMVGGGVVANIFTDEPK